MGATSRASTASRRRVQLVAVCTVGFFALLALRATWLGAVRGPSLSAKADRQHLIEINVPARRGEIVSADGQRLALDKPSVLITADARYVRDPQKTAEAVALGTGGDAEDVARMVKALSSRTAYVILQKHASIRQERYLDKRNLPGVHFTRTTKRLYPKRRVAGQIIGFTNTDTGDGIEGIEKQQNSKLAGQAGRRVEVRDPELGKTVRLQDVRDPVPGTGVTLSINASVNQKMDEILLATRNKYRAKSATGVIMDPQTGDIIAMGTVPRIDANDRQRLNTDNVRNRAVTDGYEPGSVFKLVTVAGVIEDDVAEKDTSFLVPPKFVVGSGKAPDGFTVNEAHERSYDRKMTTTEILQESSNVGTLMLSKLLNENDRLRYWMVRFGFGTKTGVDLGGETRAQLPKLPWNTGQRWNIPLGQGMTASQLQQVRAYAAIANGGYLVTPRFVTHVGGSAVAPAKRERILKEETTKEVTSMLRKVVEGTDGTAPDARLENYSVAGKTGTAEKVDPNTGRYYKDRYRASFIGFVPAGKPRLVISVMIDEPDPAGPRTGGAVAAPAFRDIADFALGALDIPPE